MLTVKHILPNGEELIHPTGYANYRPGLTAKGARCVCLLVDGRDDDVMMLETGIAYVMNDRGATVAKYDLDYVPDPFFVAQGEVHTDMPTAAPLDRRSVPPDLLRPTGASSD